MNVKSAVSLVVSPANASSAASLVPVVDSPEELVSFGPTTSAM